MLVFRILATISAVAVAGHLLAAQATPPHTRIGLVIDGSADAMAHVGAPFRQQLQKHGYIEGRNLQIHQSLSKGDQASLPALMRQVVERNVDVIVTNGTPAAVAAKRATNVVPIIALGMADPVRAGVVASLPRPGGNLTGMSMGFSEAFSGKWLEILQEVVPRLTTVGVIVNPNNPMHRLLRKDVSAAAAARRLKVRMIEVSTTADLEDGFKDARQNTQAALVFGDAVTLSDVRKVALIAAVYRIPVMYGLRGFVEAGGLISYAPDVRAQVRRAADYADMIMKGARPGDLPVEEPTQFELVVNLPAAHALGLTISDSILLRADEVIR